MEKKEEHLWQECKEVFRQTKNTQTQKLLNNLVNIVKKYKDILCSVSDNNFLEYISTMNSLDFVAGSNGDNYELILKGYIEKEECGLEEIWRILSQLIWDLSALVSDKVCPSCRGDHLAYYTDRTNTNLYESCLGCFSTWENTKLIMRPKEIFPAPKSVLIKFQVI